MNLNTLIKVNAIYIVFFAVGLTFGGSMFLELIGYETVSDEMINVAMWLGVAVFGIALMNWKAESFTGSNLKPFGMMQVWVWVPFILINIYTLATGVVDFGVNLVSGNMFFGPVIVALFFMNSKD